MTGLDKSHIPLLFTFQLTVTRNINRLCSLHTEYILLSLQKKPNES